MSRTITASYRFPPARPWITVDRCTPDDLLDIAGGAAHQLEQLRSLCDSEDHVRAICRLLVERIEPKLRAAQEMYQSELAERNRLAGLHHKLSMELALVKSFDRAARAITGKSFNDLNTEMDNGTL